MKLQSWILYCVMLGLVEASSNRGANVKEVISRLEKSLLNMFGLKEKPKVDASKVKIPAHMIKLYKIREQHEKMHHHRIRRDLGEEVDQSLNVLMNDKNINIYGSTVRSYSHIENVDDKFHPSHGMLLKFNVSTLPSKEKIEEAELRISHGVHPAVPPSLAEKKRRKFSRNELRILQRVYVYDIIRPARGHHNEIRRLLDTKVVDPRINDTVSLDVRSAIARWIRKPKNNHGIYVEVSSLRPNVLDSPFRDGKNFRLRRSLQVKVDSDEWSEQQPLLILHTDDGSIKPREKRNVQSTASYKRPSCKRHDLLVDFRKVEWNNWIVAPPGYEAFYCQGQCPYPLPSHMNATNHAVIQNLLHSKYPERVPSACCVPIKHSAISMLYLDAEKKVVLKTYQDMVVESCGCQ